MKTQRDYSVRTGDYSRMDAYKVVKDVPTLIHRAEMKALVESFSTHHNVEIMLNDLCALANRNPLAEQQLGELMENVRKYHEKHPAGTEKKINPYGDVYKE